MSIPIDRREFLKLGLLAASAQLAPLRSWNFAPQALPHAASPKKVLVVGAGLAGLVSDPEKDRYVVDSGGDRLLNIWSPWPVAAIRHADHGQRIQPWTENLDYICQNEKPVVRQYLESWFAHNIQHSEIKPQQCIGLIGIEGSGKGLIGETYSRLFGRNYAEITKKELDSDFNEWVIGKHYCMGSEITGDDNRKYVDALKHIVSGKTLWLNPKHVAKYEMHNHLVFLFTSNHRDAFFVSMKERRFLLIDMPDAKLKDSWGEAKIARFAAHWKEKRNLEALMYHLLTFTINPEVYKPQGSRSSHDSGKATGGRC
jgi:hypothetical protein